MQGSASKIPMSPMHSSIQAPPMSPKGDAHAHAHHPGAHTPRNETQSSTPSYQPTSMKPESSTPKPAPATFPGHESNLPGILRGGPPNSDQVLPSTSARHADMSASTQPHEASPGKEAKVRFVPAVMEVTNSPSKPSTKIDKSMPNASPGTGMVWYSSSKDPDSKPPQDTTAKNASTPRASPGGNAQANSEARASGPHQPLPSPQMSHAEIHKKRMEDLLREQKAREDEVKRLNKVSLALAEELKASSASPSASPPKMGDLPGHSQQRPSVEFTQTQTPVQHIGARALFVGAEDRQHVSIAEKESGQIDSTNRQDAGVFGALEVDKVAKLEEVCVCVCVCVRACVCAFVHLLHAYACSVACSYVCKVQYICTSMLVSKSSVLACLHVCVMYANHACPRVPECHVFCTSHIFCIVYTHVHVRAGKHTTLKNMHAWAYTHRYKKQANTATFKNPEYTDTRVQIYTHIHSFNCTNRYNMHTHAGTTYTHMPAPSNAHMYYYRIITHSHPQRRRRNAYSA
jgi:hypothetical protein